jgi:PAS domain S-box-containing protein
MDIDVRRVLDSLRDPMLALDRSARILHANTGLRELLGWSRMELLGRPLSQVVPGGLPGLASEAGGAPDALPLRPSRVTALRRDGRPREVEVRLSPWTGGEAGGVVIASFRELDALLEFERQVQRFRRLSIQDAAVAQALADLTDEEEAAQALLKVCGEVGDWALGTWWREEEEDGRLQAVTVWSSSAELLEFVNATQHSTFARGEGLPGAAWAQRQPVWSRSVPEDKRFLRAEQAARVGLQGGLFVPVLGARRVYGVLELLSRTPREDQVGDEAAASTLGHQFGRFLDRLYWEEAERARDAGLRQLWNADLLGLFLSDLKGKILDANPALLRMLGYTWKELRDGKLSWTGLMPPWSRALSEQGLKRLRKGGATHCFEGELLRKDDHPVPVLLGSVGMGEGLMATSVLELSDWKPVEDTAQRSADARLHQLLAHAPVVLFALDGRGTFTLSEGQSLQALGLKPGQVVGLSVFDYARAESSLLAHVRRALAGEEFFCVDELSNGQLWETHWTPLRDAQGHLAGTLGLAVDITQRERETRWRSRLLEEAQEARAAAENAVRLRDEFLTIASHELKTPLTSLNLQLQSLLRGARKAEDGPLAGRLDKAQRQIQKLARLMDDLLDVSRLTTGRVRLLLEEVDLVQVVHEVLERFQEEPTRDGTRLRWQGEAAVVGRWDRGRLEQVVTNLVANAMKYGAGAPVEVSVRSSGAMALLEVKDEGIGIAPEDLERIFGKFERAVPVRRYGGFGLGLYIVRQWVEALGGAVDVESSPGHGATFRVVLPLAGPEEHPTPAAPEQPGLH